VSFVQGDIEALPFEDERFDFLWSRDMRCTSLPPTGSRGVRTRPTGGRHAVYTTVATGRTGAERSRMAVCVVWPRPMSWTKVPSEAIPGGRAPDALQRALGSE